MCYLACHLTQFLHEKLLKTLSQSLKKDIPFEYSDGHCVCYI
uniref:Uncharacterized protein n=1 Tax=Rhizophora mucronata TaxID=61149 RepID=A0A2P2PXA0_RHIMU